MEKIKVPAPIVAENLQTGMTAMEPIYEEKDGENRMKVDGNGQPVLKAMGPLTVYGFLTRFVFPDPKIGKGKKGAKTIARLTKAFKNAKEGDEITIDTADVEAVKRVFDEPTNDWNLSLASQYEPFLDMFV